MFAVSLLPFVLTSASRLEEPILFREGLAISGVVAGGRLPVFRDSVQDLLVHEKWTTPKAGDSVMGLGSNEAKWHSVKADKDGNFGNLGNGYVSATYDSPSDQTLLLTAAGDSLVYVNGEPRGGDPYSYGYLKIPVKVHKGVNEFLFVVGRGQLRASLTKPVGAIQIETGDLTLPDILIGGNRDLYAGIVFLNTTDQDRTYQIEAKNSAGKVTVSTAMIPAMSLRKVPVKLNVPGGDLGKDQKFEILAKAGNDSDRATITLGVKKPNEVHKETFISEIDGSLQYYGVNPAQKPAKDNALILSLHGASVEGIGQASAYSSKDWCTLVAATNRRPYGFDWEDIGRLDALEVLELAKKRFPHPADHVHLTGHSMGGHGTWSVGSLYPDQFASIAPSAGWVSFWSYAGGYKPSTPSSVEKIMTRAMAGSDTLGRAENLKEEKVYILHGDADDNVPVTEARTMKKVLTDMHADFGYHEQPGAGHWWGLPNMGAACVDWPEIFEQIKTSRIEKRDSINFTTPSPAISSHDEWVTVLQQVHAMEPSQVKFGLGMGVTKNVAALRLDREFEALTLDKQEMGRIAKGTTLVLKDGKWTVGCIGRNEKSPENSGPFKNVYRNRFMFVVATHGNTEENLWAVNKARFDAETYQYRGNGTVDIVRDVDFQPGSARNVILYGNADTNSAWKSLLGKSPVQVARNSVKVGDRVLLGDDLCSMFVYPRTVHGKPCLVGAVSGTGLVGLRTLDRLPVFTSGVAFPDWTVMSADVLKLGAKGIKGCGFFGNDWTLKNGDAAWNE